MNMKNFYKITATLFLIGLSLVVNSQVSTFNYNGGQQTWVVPNCCISVTVDVQGAYGGNSSCMNGGNGGRVEATIPVTPGQTLYIYCGQSGNNQCSQIFNGGGQSYDCNQGYGVAGGGASDIRIGGTSLSDRKIVAGGGGGAPGYYYNNCCQQVGGNGGNLTGQNGYRQCNNSYDNCTCGSGGTQTSGGQGANCYGANSGQLGLGGQAYRYGGGGGGGYYGGGAGAYGGAGGGGSSYTASTATNVTHTQGYRSGDGVIYITPNVGQTPPASIAGSTLVCPGNTNTYSVTPLAGVTSYTWTVPTGSTIVSGQGTSSIVATNGTTSGNIGCSASGPCGTSTVRTLAITLANFFAIPVTTATPSAVCIGSPSQLSAISGDSIQWWTAATGGTLLGTTASAANFPVTPLSTTTYYAGAPQGTAPSIFKDSLHYTGGFQIWTVPAGVTSITVEVNGAEGGNHIQGSNNIGGEGGVVNGTYAVTPGQILRIYVGGTTASPTGGYNGGGNGGTNSNYTAGGGGASDIRVSPYGVANRIFVGAGGGGAGWNCSENNYGGKGGGLTGEGGFQCGTEQVNMGGTQTAGGQGNNSGSLWGGGNGSNSNSGGGGGGYYGGGANNWRGGGGGSNFASSTATAVTHIRGTRLGNGLVTISYAGTIPVCAAVTRAPVLVTVNALPTVLSSSSPATICSGATSTLSGSGASTYTWMPGNLNGSTIFVTPTTTTTYTVTGTNTNGCSNTAIRTITVNPLPIVTATSTAAAVCNGSSVMLSGGGASSYLWSGGVVNAVSFVPTATATYTVTGTDANGCVNTANTTVAVNAVPSVSASTSAATICSGAGVTLTASGNSTTYNWMPGNLVGATITTYPTSTTTYTLTGTGSNGCSSTATVTVNVNSNPIVTANTSSPAVCIGSNVTLTGGGATSYTWSSGVTDGLPFAPIINFTYTVTGTNANGCTGSATTYVVVNPLPVVTTAVTIPTVCSGGSTSISATGGIYYSWMPGNLFGPSVSVSPTSSTVYLVTVSNLNGCISTGMVAVTVNPLPVVTATSSSAAVCAGGSVTLTGGGATSYVWNNNVVNSVSFVPTVTAIYTVTGTGSNGCTNTASTTVIVNSLPLVTATCSSPISCVGSSVTLTGGGASSYTWSNNVINALSFIPNSTATYTVTGTNANGCLNTATTTVTVNPLPVVTATSTAATVCAGSNVTLTGGGATFYTWDNNVTNGVSFVPTATATYIVTGIVYNGCTNTDTTTITVNPLPVVTATSSTAAVCIGSSVTLTGGGASSYMWTNNVMNAVSFVPTTTATYTVTGTGSNGCTNTASATVAVNNNPVVSLGSDIVQCAGSATFNAGNIGSTYMWNNTSISQTITVSSSGTYIVAVTNPYGCMNRDTIIATFNPLPIVNLGADVTQCGGSVLLDAGNVGSMFMWSNASTSQTINVNTSGSYIIAVTDGNGCINRDTAMVTINALPVVSAMASSVVVCVDDTLVTLTGTPSGGVWSGAGVTGTSFSPTAAGIGTQIATYSYQDSLGCEDTASVTIEVNECVGFVENTLANGVNVYPNPNNGSFMFSINANVGDVTISITDMQGRVVYSSIDSNVNAGFVKQISLDTQSSGMYLMHIGAKGEQQIKKIAVQK